LPARWRQRLSVNDRLAAPFTLLTGLLQIVGGILLLWIKFPDYVTRWVQAAEGGDRASHMVFGATLWLGFLFFSGWGWLGLFSILEGMARAAAGAAGQTLATLPLFVIERVIFKGKQSAAADRSPIAADELRRVGDRVEIWRSRPTDWDEMITIDIDDEPYVLESKSERETGLRRYVYTLKPIPRGWVFRRRIRYP
jgi:hypothetical protein